MDTVKRTMEERVIDILSNSEDKLTEREIKDYFDDNVEKRFLPSILRKMCALNKIKKVRRLEKPGSQAQIRYYIEKVEPEPKTTFEVGDRVESVGGFFTEGIVRKIINSKEEIYEVEWIEDSRGKELMPFTQERTARVLRKIR